MVDFCADENMRCFGSMFSYRISVSSCYRIIYITASIFWFESWVSGSLRGGVERFFASLRMTVD